MLMNCCTLTCWMNSSSSALFLSGKTDIILAAHSFILAYCNDNTKYKYFRYNENRSARIVGVIPFTNNHNNSQMSAEIVLK